MHIALYNYISQCNCMCLSKQHIRRPSQTEIRNSHKNYNFAHNISPVCRQLLFFDASNEAIFFEEDLLKENLFDYKLTAAI